MKHASVPASNAVRSVIDETGDVDPQWSPDGLNRSDAYRVVWQTARDVREAAEPPAPVTPWMRLSEEEKAEVRAARRRARFGVVAGEAAAFESVRRAA